MNVIKVCGGASAGLEGTVCVQGCKNSALPILAATLINAKTNIIHNCPALSDVYIAMDIIKSLGCNVEYKDCVAVVDSSHISSCTVSKDLMGAMRSSVIFAGALLSRCGKAIFTLPGGCDIGTRPIDIHLASFEKMGVDVTCTDGCVECRVDNLRGADIHLPLPSVGATENIMLLGAKSKGVTRIYNAAREPEIYDLQEFLNSMGARICGAGTSLVTIYGVDVLHDSQYHVMPDRIEAITYACACAVAGGTVSLEGACYEHMASPMYVLCKMGVIAVPYAKSVTVCSKHPLICPHVVSTGGYPGFPTDAQSLIMTAMSCAKGSGVIVENIFENRFGHAEQLGKMGAHITIDGNRAMVEGGPLYGADTSACDLRSGAALVIAGLAATGDTFVEKCEYIDRGYSDFERKLNNIGACVERI